MEVRQVTPWALQQPQQQGLGNKVLGGNVRRGKVRDGVKLFDFRGERASLVPCFVDKWAKGHQAVLEVLSENPAFD
jgi:hypothetical protein